MNYGELVPDADKSDFKEANAESIGLDLYAAEAYTRLLQSSKASNIVHAVSADDSSRDGEDAENIMIRDDELSQMFGKGDFVKLYVVG